MMAGLLPRSIRPWTSTEIAEARTRIVERRGRRDSLEAMAQFVGSEARNLVRFVNRAGFFAQQAYNAARDGPIAAPAEAAVHRIDPPRPLLLRHAADRPRFNPWPPVVRVLDQPSRYIPTYQGQYGSDPRVMAFDPLLALSADGRRAISASLDATMVVWDVENGRCVQTLEGRRLSDDPSNEETGPLLSGLAITGDGCLAASRSRDGELRLWDPESAHCIWILRDPAAERWTRGPLAFSMAGRLLLSADAPGDVSAWDLESRQRLYTTTAPPGAANVVALLANEALAVSSGQADRLDLDRQPAISIPGDPRIYIWNVATGQVRRVLEGHSGHVGDVALAERVSRVVSGSVDGTLRVWDLDSGACRQVLDHGARIVGVAVAADGRWALSAGVNGEMRVWDVESGACLRTLPARSRDVASLALSLDGRVVVTASVDTRVYVWDIERGFALDHRGAHHGGVSDVFVTADRDGAVSTSTYDVRRWHLSSCQESSSLARPLPANVTARDQNRAAVTPDGRRAFSTEQGDQDADQLIQVWDVATGGRLHTLAGHTQAVRGLAACADSRRVVSGSNDRTVRVWDLDTGVCRTTCSVSMRADALLPLRDQRGFIAFDGMDATWWDLNTGKAVASLPLYYSGAVVYSGLTPDGCSLVIGCEADVHGAYLHVVDMRRRQAARQLNREADSRHRLKVTTWAMTPDGRRAASGSYDGTVAIWDVGSGRRLHSLAGHSHWVQHVVTTTDGLHVISAGKDRSIRVWHILSGECVAVLACPAEVTALTTFGDLLIAGDQAGDVTFRAFMALRASRRS